MSPELAQFRKEAEETPPARLDGAYLYFAAALPENVSEADYHDFVRQMSDSDPNTRANGICGVAAAKQPASLDHLLRALRTETDPFNRTMIVWCMRGYANDPRTGRALEEFLYGAKDIDFQRCLLPNGRIVYVRFPPPMAGAAFEAFKALLAIRGRDYMVHGEGWRRFAERFEKNIDPRPCGEIDMSRFQSRPGASDFDVNREAQRLIEEFRREK
ncbi:MAG: hypothetical protein ACPMAQ_00385 [Phycisphaerae bacterium]